MCLSSSPSNAKLLRTAARMANAVRSDFTALFVETPAFSAMKAEDKKRLQDNVHLARQLGAKIETVYGDDIPLQIAEFARLSGVSKIVIGRSAAAKKHLFHLARQLGAKIETVYGDDIPLQIAEFARLSGVSKIVIGRSAAAKKHLFSKPTLIEKLIAHAPNLDVHIIPDTTFAPVPYYAKKSKRIRRLVFSPADLAKSIGILLAASGIGFLFQKLGFAEANIITVYVLGVLLTSAITTHWIYSLISSIVSVLLFNFLFTVPRFSLEAYDQGYPVTFIIMFLAALLTGSLATQLKNHAKQFLQPILQKVSVFCLLQVASGFYFRN